MTILRTALTFSPSLTQTEKEKSSLPVCPLNTFRYIKYGKQAQRNKSVNYYCYL